jgi:hypothetical protein
MRQIVWYALKRGSAAGNVKRTQSGCPGIHAVTPGPPRSRQGLTDSFFQYRGKLRGRPRGLPSPWLAQARQGLGPQSSPARPSGHATVAPPSSVMKSRRLMGSSSPRIIQRAEPGL